MAHFITETHVAPIDVMSQIAVLPDKVFQQCQDLVVQSLDEGLCRAQRRIQINFIQYFEIYRCQQLERKKNTIIQERKNYIKTQNRRRDRKERRQMKNDADMLGRLPAPNRVLL